MNNSTLYNPVITEQSVMDFRSTASTLMTPEHAWRALQRIPMTHSLTQELQPTRVVVVTLDHSFRPKAPLHPFHPSGFHF